jgi:hypothetical protein
MLSPFEFALCQGFASVVVVQQLAPVAEKSNLVRLV